MVLIFVYVMTFYNAGLESGVTFATFGYALTHMWVEVIGAFIAQRYIAAPIVKTARPPGIYTGRGQADLYHPCHRRIHSIYDGADNDAVCLHLSHGPVSGTSGALVDEAGTEFPVRTVCPDVLCRTAGATDLPHDLQKTAQSYSLIAPRRPSPPQIFSVDKEKYRAGQARRYPVAHRFCIESRPGGK